MSYLSEMLSKLGKEELIPLSENVVSNCFEFMKPSLMDYKPMNNIKVKFPVQPVYLNPNRAMQGGFISAAFDNVFGVFCFLSSGRHGLSLDLNTSFFRPIYENDELTITVYLNHLGGTLIHMRGEAHNNSGELAAVSDTKMIFAK